MPKEPNANVRTFSAGNHTLVVRGRLPRVAQLKQEFYYEVEDPIAFIAKLRESDVPADLFTFLHTFPHEGLTHPFFTEMDNFAVIPISSYANWFENEIPKQTRRGIRKSRELGVEVRWANFDDEFIQDVASIFNESPNRQGRPFWHYGKGFGEVKEVLSRDFDRCQFLGAYVQGELVGFIKFLFGRNFARTTLIMSKVAHRNKYPNNALISRAIEVCVERGIPYLVYGQIDYGAVGNRTLSEFKIHNGFRRFDLPRYIVPLTVRGRLALRLGLQHGVVQRMPKNLVQFALRIRRTIYPNRPVASVDREQDAS